MLAYQKGAETLALDFDSYYIQQEWNGWEDTLHLSLPTGHPQRCDLCERLRLTDQQTGQIYAITAIDEGKTTADITAMLDLDALQTTMLIGWTNGSDTVANTITGVLPAGWRVVDGSGMTIRRTIPEDAQTPFNGTPLDVIKQCVSTFDGVAVRFDNAERTVQLCCPANNEESGAYYTDELNLTERPQFKGKAGSDYYTRLYAYGKDGLSIAGVNGGVAFVDCHDYDDRVICRYWKDERHTVAESLLDAAKAMVAKAAVPARSYTCTAVDLARIDPERYAYQGVALYQVVALLDRERGTRTAHKVAQYRYYPHHPEKNVITLSTVPGTVTGKAQAAYDAIVNPTTSKIGAEIRAAQAHLQNLITGAAGGHIVLNFGDDGQTAELLCMDTADKATCKQCIRLNKEGIGFSKDGYNGPFNAAIGIDGGLFSQWIATWQLTANIIKTGVLQDVNGTNWLNLDTGEVHLASYATTEYTNEKSTEAINSANQNTSNALANYTTIEKLNSSIETSAASIKLEVGKSYATKDSLGNYTPISEVRSKFAMDATSVSIDSGNIRFNGNTISINTDHFQLWGNGNISADGSFSSYNANSTGKMVMDGGHIFGYYNNNTPDWTQTMSLWSDWYTAGLKFNQLGSHVGISYGETSTDPAKVVDGVILGSFGQKMTFVASEEWDRRMLFGVYDSRWTLCPANNGYIGLGTPEKPWADVYCNNIYILDRNGGKKRGIWKWVENIGTVLCME